MVLRITIHMNFNLIVIQLLQIAEKINMLIRDLRLRDIGQLEQDLVFGDVGTKEVINFLRVNQVLSISFEKCCC